MFDPSAPHIIILFIVVLLLFGSRRLPGAAKSLGQSMHIFKKSVAGLDVDEERPNAATGTAPNASTAINPATTTLPPSVPVAQNLAVGQPLSGQDQSAQIQELQRQVEELQRQTAAGSAGQSSQPF
ncbi:MAG TPA: twin-arginine translocase TatA/TatE family subunit [Streptosporangiaceae bacterium]|nr:twin-arginine translocase TatA/TatE family subunit [Streptosporangiaceae bacterium]